MGLRGLCDHNRAKTLHILFSGCKKLHIHVSDNLSNGYIETQNCTVPPLSSHSPTQNERWHLALSDKHRETDVFDTEAKRQLNRS
jgi:hypothetical protein